MSKFSARSQCAGKIKHPTRKAASAAILFMHKKDGLRVSDFLAYNCPHCSAWHVGRKAKLKANRK